MRTIAVANSKGGVGKTTSVVEVASHAARMGKRVLLIDTDHQANLTRTILGEIPLLSSPTLYSLLVEECDLAEGLYKADDEFWPNTWLIPANHSLQSIEVALSNSPYWVEMISDILNRVEKNFDICLIDTAPSTNLLTQMSINACTTLLIPTDTSTFSRDGIEKILGLQDAFKKRGKGFDIKIRPTRKQKGGAKSVMAATSFLKANYPDQYRDVDIPDVVKVLEAQQSDPPRSAMTLLSSEDRLYKGYEEVTKELMED